MTASFLGAFIAAAFLLNASPGPSTLFVMSRSVNGGRAAGVSAALGLATGSTLWAIVTALGFSRLIASSPPAFTGIRVIGALYLLYLGVRSFFDKPFISAERDGSPPVPPGRSYLQGLAVEGGNPKTIAFFIALVPQVIAGAHTSAVAAVIALCLIVPLTAIPIDVSIGLTGGTLATRIARRPLAGRALNYLACAALIALAAVVAIT